MKRFVGSLVLSGVSVWAFSQAPFTIVRPPDGARVREKVKIDVPAHSIPPGGYIGVFLNDQLIDAVVPPLVGRYYEYTLDTKGRQIADTAPGKTDKLELKLYTDYDEKARLVDTSSVNIKIGNNANIPVPPEGLRLRYKFVPGQEMVYDLTQHIETSSLTQAQADDDSKPATFDTEGESARIAYDVVNSYPDGDGLLCMMFLPTKGKDYADITPDHGTVEQRWTEQQMTPVYMRVTPTGHEVFGAITEYFGFDGIPQPAAAEQLLPLHPLPTLPSKPVHDGDEWASRLQLAANVNPNDWVDINSIVEPFPAKGQFVGVEWERNHPCAKLQNVIEAGVESANKGTKKPYSGDRVSVTETIYFALDTHQILKIVRDLNIDRKVESTNPMGGGMGGPGMPGMGGPPGMGGRGRPPGVPGGLGVGGGGDQMTGEVDIKQAGIGGFGGKGGMRPGGGMGGPGMPPGMGGFGGPGGPGGRFGGGMNGAGGGTPAPPTYVRMHIFQTLTLES